MENIDEHYIDWEEFEDALLLFCKDYRIKTGDLSISFTMTFVEIMELLFAQFDFQHKQDCTSQQAFYKLRKGIQEIYPNAPELTLDTELKDLFPKNNRRKNIAELKKKLGIDFKILGAEKWLTSVLGITILVCFFLMFFQLWALAAFIFSIIVLQVAERYGRAFKGKTIRDLVHHLVIHHYFECRTEPNSINKEEFRKVAFAYFSEALDIDQADLHTARFV